MYTISRFGEIFGISRSTLLYYEKLGLLKSAKRTTSGYRLYSEEDKTRLEQIMLYRTIGVPLKKIKQYLKAPQNGVLPILLNRLLTINNEIESLHTQQKLLLDMVEAEGTLKGKKPFLDKMKSLGEEAGIHEGNYEKIHRVFEKTTPKAHRKLLSFLGFTDTEIKDFIIKINKKD